MINTNLINILFLIAISCLILHFIYYANKRNVYCFKSKRASAKLYNSKVNKIKLTDDYKDKYIKVHLKHNNTYVNGTLVLSGRLSYNHYGYKGKEEYEYVIETACILHNNGTYHYTNINNSYKYKHDKYSYKTYLFMSRRYKTIKEVEDVLTKMGVRPDINKKYDLQKMYKRAILKEGSIINKNNK